MPRDFFNTNLTRKTKKREIKQIGNAKHRSRSADAVIRVYDCSWQRDRDARARWRFQKAVRSETKSRHAVKRGDFLTELINCRCAGFYYGHCGKKFSEKVPGEVSQSPAPGADTETFVKSTETKTSFWPPGHVKVAFGGGSIVREPLIEPFLPDVNMPCAVTVPVTVDLLAALGHFCPWFRQAYTALPSAEAVTVSD